MPTEEDVHDLIAYPGFAYRDTHPDRLATMGLLHELDTAPVAHCRVLEIGCNEGANLIPMAYAIPGSEFVGFDLARLPIGRGQQRIRELGLTNIRLFQADLMEVGAELGHFDYIVAHGVYAWVPGPVRDRLLALCREHLSSSGIAFVSYNALPGGHVRNMIAQILQEGVRGAADPIDGVNRGFGLLQMAIANRAEGEPLRVLLEKEAKAQQQRSPHSIFHDELCAAQQPVSFADFAAHAARHGLQYLCESVLPPPNDPCFQPEAAARAKALAAGDPIAEEQILDIVRMRAYRETLLCHVERQVTPDLSLEAIGRLHLSSPAESSSRDGLARVYTQPGGIGMETRHPGTILLMETLLAAWPESVPFAQLTDVLHAHRMPFDAEFQLMLLRLVVNRMIDLHAWHAPVRRSLAERPKASATSRQEAARGTRTFSLLHTAVDLEDSLARQCLRLLDGTRDRAALLQALRESFPSVPEAELTEGLEPNLRRLHRMGVLLAEDCG